MIRVALLQVIIFLFLAGVTGTASATDTARLNRIIKRALPMVYSDPDSAYVLFEEALTLSRELNSSDGECLCYSFMGFILNNEGRSSEGFELYRKAFRPCHSLRTRVQSLPNLYINIGASHFQNGNLDSANIYYYHALSYMEARMPESNNLSIVYCNLSAITSSQGDYEKALRQATRADSLARTGNVPLARLPALINMGNMYAVLGYEDSALNCFEQGLEIARAHGYTGREKTLLCSIGDMILEAGDPARSIGYYRQALSLPDDRNLLLETIISRYRLGIAYYRLGNHDSAERELITGLRLADSSGINHNKVLAHQILSSVYEHTGKYRAALEQKKIAQQLNDSLYNVEKTRAILEIESKYNAAQKDKTIAEGELQIARQQRHIERISLLSAGGILIVLLTGSIVYILFRNRVRAERKEKELEKLKAQMLGEETERKRISRELHDGIGGLLTSARLTIQSLGEGSDIVEENIGNLSDLLAQISNEVQHTAHNLMPDILEERNLWFALSAYCDQVERSSGVPIELHTMGEASLLNPAVSLPLYRIAQELVQNAVKHSGGTQVFVQARFDTDAGHILLSVEDNGSGFDTEKAYDGLGIKSVRERVKVLNGFLSIASGAEMGTTIFIDIDLKKLEPVAAG